MRGSLGFSILIVIGLTLGIPSFSTAQDARQLLAGVWSRNAEHSDDTENLERDALESLPQPPGRSGGVIGVVIGRPARTELPIGFPGGFGFPRGFDPELIRQAVAEATHAAERMVLTFNAADTLLLGLDRDAPYLLVADGKKSKRTWIDGAQVEIKTSWKGRALRIERKLENDLEITQTFALERESGRLILTIDVDGPIPREIEVRHVYDRVLDTPP